MKHKIQVFLFRHVAVIYDIKNANIIHGIHMLLWAMTTHAILRQQGYQLNPFNLPC
jgi:hypothetical protein